MEHYRATIILVCVAAYMVMCLLIGLWAMRRTKSTSDYFMAGRSLGIVVTGVAVFSSMMSGFGFVGGPGLVYRLRLLATARWWAGGGGLLLLLWALQTPHPSTPRRHGQPLRRGAQLAERVLAGAS